MYVETPCVVIDIDKTKENLKKMSDICKSSNCKLRPHIKTHKTRFFSDMQLEYGANGITVATLSEAEAVVSESINDIFMAYPIIGDKNIERAIALAKKVRFIGAVDSYEGAKAISDKAEDANIILEVRLEIDLGMRRTGVIYEKAVEEAEKINSLKGIKLQGIFDFRGMIYNGKKDLDREKCGIQEGQLMVALAEQMRAKGIDIVDVSTGSTPTAEFNVKVPGVTEVRPGTYIFQDMMQLNTGACSNFEDISAFVLTTIVSNAKDDMIVVDAGCKSISMDAALNEGPYYLKQCGNVIGHEDLIFSRFSEEHGMVDKTEIHNEYNVGDKLKIVPNHICTTINFYDHVYLAKDNEIYDKLSIDARGKNF